MPAEERKFRRRSIVAFPPTCNRELESAASHTAVSDGISTTGVTVDRIAGVAVGKGRAVKVGAGMFVPVGDGMKTASAVNLPEVNVPVGEGIGVIGRKVAVNPLEVEVPVGDGITGAVDVNALEAEVGVADDNGDAVSVVALDIEV